VLSTDVLAARAVSRRQPRSERWEPLVRGADDFRDGLTVETWGNRWYHVTVRRHAEGWRFDPSMPWAQLGISCPNGDARHDWREFQLIKNEVVGPEWEAVELWPAESRLLDPSNYYLLWAAPGIPLGKFVGRRVATPETCIAPQRGWKGGSHA
jgi:hypothetical protein